MALATATAELLARIGVVFPGVAQINELLAALLVWIDSIERGNFIYG